MSICMKTLCILKTKNMRVVQNSEVTANNFDEVIICIYWYIKTLTEDSEFLDSVSSYFPPYKSDVLTIRLFNH